MSPQLARENFFVFVLNQIKNETVKSKEETQLQQLLLEIGEELLQAAVFVNIVVVSLFFNYSKEKPPYSR
ncbi:hypothetical protein [Enterococcus saccharolyticus]|uniref:hypothetical protein n=1 Tax=Enterococcus saccharolyticus TaxID=41997 RepID=UPI0039DF3B1B